MNATERHSLFRFLTSKHFTRLAGHLGGRHGAHGPEVSWSVERASAELRQSRLRSSRSWASRLRSKREAGGTLWSGFP